MAAGPDRHDGWLNGGAEATRQPAAASPGAPLAGYGDVLLPTLLGLQITFVPMALLLLNQGP
ncbi:hypothetical protein KQ298_07255 [Synechococcus sp. CS-1330]|nr:hypothetical protein [Synechococcus sp. CS-1330]